MGSDGNCLFRSISDQLYGTPYLTQEHSNIMLKLGRSVWIISLVSRASSRTMLRETSKNTSTTKGSMECGVMMLSCRQYRKYTVGQLKYS